MASELSIFDRTLLSELADGARKVFANAEALYLEAKLLGDVAAISRALFLHQISLEECAKIETIGAWATSLLAGIAVDEKQVLAGFASHSGKNGTNAYMLEATAKEKAAKELGDWNTAREEFKSSKPIFTGSRTTLKTHPCTSISKTASSLHLSSALPLKYS
jgi:AbiV family abortive infection protein